jgi:hypothetical protein
VARWVKRGRVFAPERDLPWEGSHAAVPCARVIDGAVRVFFSPRDPDGRSHVAWFDLDPVRPEKPVRVADAPALEPGPPGAFDESGAMGSWVVDVDREIWLYYIGWTKGVTVPFYNSIGLARSHDGGQTFERVAAGPIVGRDRIDPYFTGSSCVMVDEGSWRMWYLSCTGWEVVDGRPVHSYHIRHATSEDGLDWRRDGRPCIDFEHDGEHAISRPSVIRDGGLYRMWYSWRGPSYRIGYAESADGVGWVRKDAEAGIGVSAEGWDSESVEYPCVFDYEDRRWMLYNGNGYGETGIGLAELVDLVD